MQRVLVVDGSNLMRWLVEQQVPGDVLVEQAATFTEAHEILTGNPPQAVIFNITPGHLKWRLLVDLCHRQDPPIPFVCCTSLPDNPGLLIEVPCGGENAVAGPLTVTDLGRCLRKLVDHAASPEAASRPRDDRLQ